MRVASSALLLLGAASSSLAFILPARLASAPLSSRRSVLSMATSTSEATELKDIVDTAVGAGSFSTLATALTVAGLVDTLKSSGPFTVFAPTDEAFAKIPKPTLDAILSDKAKLTSILTYHVLPGMTKAQDILTVPSAKTVQGSSLSVKVSDGKVKVGGANVLATDVMASNGVIHVIDTVLLPPAPVSSTPVKPSLASIEVNKAGATAPFGFFDPLGLSAGKTPKEMKKYRESELKHGRIAMLATVGIIVQEAFSPFYNPESGLSADPGPAAFHFQKLEAVNPFVLGYIGVLVAVLEAFTISKGWDSKNEYGGSDIAGLKDDYLTGDFAFDPLNLAPKKDQDKFIDMRSKELNNGRLAMIAWWGMVLQELATGHKLFA